MTTTLLLGILAFGTMGAVVVFAFLSVQKTEERRQSDKQKSTLAADSRPTTPPGQAPPDV